MKIQGVLDDDGTVGRQKAQEVVKAWQDGGGGTAALASLKAGLPAEVKRVIDEIIERSGFDMKTQKKLRQARITELLVQDDPSLVIEGVKLSQKEDGTVAGGNQMNVQINHWSAEPPDGRELEAE